jgi:hypothetical protein
MGIFDGISEADKLRLVSLEISNTQIGLYSLLIQIGVDPDSFDETVWDEPLNMETPIGRVRHYIDLISSLRAKKLEMEQ